MPGHYKSNCPDRQGRGGGGGGRGNHHGGRGNGGGRGRGRGHNHTKNSENITPPPAAETPIRHVNGEPEFEKTIQGRKMFWCQKCNRWSTTHSTGSHTGKKSAQANLALIPDPSLWFCPVTVNDAILPKFETFSVDLPDSWSFPAPSPTETHPVPIDAAPIPSWSSVFRDCWSFIQPHVVGTLFGGLLMILLLTAVDSLPSSLASFASVELLPSSLASFASVELLPSSFASFASVDSFIALHSSVTTWLSWLSSITLGELFHFGALTSAPFLWFLLLTGSRHGRPILYHFDPDTKAKATAPMYPRPEQAKIGWHNFILGRWTYKWKIVQKAHYDRIGSRKTPKRWLTAILHKLSMICWDCQKTLNLY